MPAYSHGLLAYLWHYLIARLLYDELVRPLMFGDSTALFFAAALAVLAFAMRTTLQRRRRDRRS